MAKKRISIGIFYRPTSNWIAGAYYLQNIVSSLNQCEMERCPKIHVFCDNKTIYNDFKNITHYPYLKCRIIRYYTNKYYRILNKIVKCISGNDLFISGKPIDNRHKISFVYPANLREIRDPNKALAWIPDFQDKYLPQFFSEGELCERDSIYLDYIKNNTPIVFSSNDALNDFKKFYPQGENLKKYVLPFSVSLPNFSKENIDILKSRFCIRKQYLFCANQFWVHKNHIFLFKAFLKALTQGLNMQLVCSGKLHDYRKDDYKNEILSFIHDNKLEEDIIFTDFIERTEQLCLMHNSYAIVQPSLFEGWSTVVEDAKCLNKFIFLSDLRVHKEQNPQNACFFNPNDTNDLVDKLLNVHITIKPNDYSSNVHDCGVRFLEIVEDMTYNRAIN